MTSRLPSVSLLIAICVSAQYLPFNVARQDLRALGDALARGLRDGQNKSRRHRSNDVQLTAGLMFDLYGR